MKPGDLNILIVADEGPMVADLARQLVVETKADISIVDTLEEAKVLTASNQLDAIIAASTLDDGSGLSLLMRDGDPPHAPIIILQDDADPDRILTAMRAGAADVFTQPVDTTRLVTSLNRVVAEERRLRSAAARSKRLRRMTSRLVRDRRELRQRVDLICRDLVLAYRRLAEKVVSIQQEESTSDAQ